jgi:two-component system alkaline phosphatase synthesis response regulator PhoP
MGFKILIADDESDLREMIRYNLEHEGYEVVAAENGLQAVEMTLDQRPHLIVLDIRMPVMDGIEACRRIRQEKSVASTPIIMLTALGAERDEVGGFEAGADDYVQKPVSPKVLLTRIKARLRRAYADEKREVIACHNLEIDRERYVVRKMVDGEVEKIHLPRKQFEVLYALAEHPGIVHSREELLDRIWGEDVYVTPRTVDVHVRKIRDTIGEEYIETVKGIGYRMKE